MSAAPALLRVEDLTHRVGAAGGEPVLRSVDLTVGAPGEPPLVVALAGRSGSGKSTLCHLVAGIGRPARGRVLVLGRPADAAPDWATVSLLPQRLSLVDELAIGENIRLPQLLGGRRAEGDDVERLVRDLGLAAVADRRAAWTSLGEQQRAALARALVLRPRLAVLDEPTGHQDDARVDDVLRVVRDARAYGTTVLVATHDDRVLAVADRVVRLERGRVVADSRV